MRNLIVINVLPYAEHACIPILKCICLWSLSIYHKEDINLTKEIAMAGTHPAKPEIPYQLGGNPLPIEWKVKALFGQC